MCRVRTPLEVTVEGQGFKGGVREFDLKGPKFASWTDFKTWRSKHVTGYTSELWKGRDLGFATAFPKGISFTGCGAQDGEAPSGRTRASWLDSL